MRQSSGGPGISRTPSLLVALLSAVAVGCGGSETPATGGGGIEPGPGGGEGGGGSALVGVPAVLMTSARLTMQERLTVEAFEAELASDADLIGAAEGLALSDAGRAEDDAGAEVLWGEGITASGDVQAAVRWCDGEGCVVARQSRDGDGWTWAVVGGGAESARPLGAPLLTKTLEGHDLSGKTTLSAGLSDRATRTASLTLDPADLPDLDFGTRTFLALNTFGPLFDTTTAPVTDVATAHGGFDAVETIDYAREADVVDAFVRLDATDAMVWLTQGVIEETKDGFKESRTVGFTVNRGGYGETLMSRDAIATAATDNVGGGPGLIFLAASYSESDGSESQPDPGSVWSKLVGTWPPGEYGGRILVGVEGSADVKQILEASAAFFDAFLSGAFTLQESLEAGTARFGFTDARLVTNRNDTDRTWLRSFDDHWADAPMSAPSSTRLTAYITGAQLCGEPGTGDLVPPDPPLPDASPFADVTFDGAAFEGENIVEMTGVSVSIHMRGVMTGWDIDDRILLEVWGDLSDNYNDFHAFAEGRIREIVEDEESGEIRVLFDGDVHAAPFVDVLGRECLLGTPFLSTKTSEKANLVLKP